MSRQRNWGVPMTFFIHKESGELHPRSAQLLEEVALRIEQQGIEPGSAWTPRSCWAKRPSNTAS
ncbi:Isoleucine--tRNA ligase [Chromobacterium violaceum]|uniref:Isoleucine--tRNA ligase n=1 Tax=Chromobacterium violaceum TaxID=536 RepID=A0A3S4HU44_CHRVL|nr:Isoleucine--tRNA ligase [Chromobacterium violaceum]